MADDGACALVHFRAGGPDEDVRDLAPVASVLIFPEAFQREWIWLTGRLAREERMK
jgi:hypothetical protein